MYQMEEGRVCRVHQNNTSITAFWTQSHMRNYRPLGRGGPDTHRQGGEGTTHTFSSGIGTENHTKTIKQKPFGT